MPIIIYLLLILQIQPPQIYYKEIIKESIKLQHLRAWDQS